MSQPAFEMKVPPAGSFTNAVKLKWILPMTLSPTLSKHGTAVCADATGALIALVVFLATLEGLLALAVAGVAPGICHGLVAFVAEVFGQSGVQRLLHQQFGQLLEQAVLANQSSGFL